MSGGEPSSTKQSLRCAARVPALSRGYEDRGERMLDFAVYGLVSRIQLLFYLTEIFAIRRCYSKAARLTAVSRRLAFSVAPYFAKKSTDNMTFGYGAI